MNTYKKQQPYLTNNTTKNHANPIQSMQAHLLYLLT